MRVVIFCLLLSACRGGSSSVMRLDTVRHNRYTVTAHPLIFETAFFEGNAAMHDSLRFCPIHIGDLRVTSGKVIAACPVNSRDAPPFAPLFPTGSFPVQLAIAKFLDRDERVAFSRVLFSVAPVARWEMALERGQKPLSIYDTTFYGYGVDGGEGLFIDSLANVTIESDKDEATAMTDSIFMYSMKAHGRPTWDYGVYQFKGQNVACFSTGFGDGSYGSYIGYDSAGGICRLVTDFGLVDWHEDK